VIPGRHEGAVDDRDRVDPAFADRRERQQRPDRVDHPVCRGMRHPEQRPDLTHRQVRPPIGRDQQHPVCQRQRPLPARATVRDLVPAPLGDQPHQLAELAGLQAGERGNPLRLRRCDHLHHNMIKYHNAPAGPTLGLRDIP
jgi:hypothetical protein